MKLFLLLLLSLLCPLVVCVSYSERALGDKIQSLPGLSVQPTFNMFSGYLQVDAASERSIFYWYIESQNNPATDPVVWWSNGGPGCSGLLGLLSEHGPFRPASNGVDLLVNPNSWNSLANMLYVEAPAGVGFSFSNDHNDYNTGDAKTAADNLVAIQQFFNIFPHLQSNIFYISAESYGGHYVPTLAQLIVNSASPLNFNFQGFLLGNPYTDPIENAFYGQYSTFAGHSLVSRPTFNSMWQHCVTAPDSTCTQWENTLMKEAGNVDLYGLDFPTCTSTIQQRTLLAHTWQNKMHLLPNKIRQQLTITPGPYDPCAQGELTQYLNQPNVQSAIHANTNLGYQWSACSSVLNYSMSDLNVRMEPIYTDLLSHSNLRFLIFSGDDDSVCASTGTQYWMNSMPNWSITTAWQQWMYDSAEYGNQIGGSFVQFQQEAGGVITFATVHGAGHMVPEYQPEKALALFSLFLAGKL